MKMSFMMADMFQTVQRNSVTLLFRFRDVLYKLMIALLTSSVIVWLSVFLYVTFYYTYMPAVSHTKPAHLQFRWCDNLSMCSFPQATIPLVKKGNDQLLMRGQQYKVFLDLEMPESPINQQLGMFMIKIEFISKTGEIVHSTSRSAMLRYKSSLHQTFSTIVLTPLLLLGTTEEKQSLSIELCDFYEEDPVKPAASVSIEIQSKPIEIYSSQLRIYAHFTGLRYMMFHWPVLSAIIGIGTNLFFLSIVALLSWYRYLVAHESQEYVVRVGFDDSRMKSIEERRNQVREFLLREKQRQSKMHASFSSFEVSGPVRKVKAGESLTRTHSLEILAPTKPKSRAASESADNFRSSPTSSWSYLASEKGGKVVKKTGPKDVGGSRSQIEETFAAKAEVNDDDEQNFNFDDDSDGSDHIIGDSKAKRSSIFMSDQSTLVDDTTSNVRLRKLSKET